MFQRGMEFAIGKIHNHIELLFYRKRLLFKKSVSFGIFTLIQNGRFVFSPLPYDMLELVISEMSAA